MKALLQGGPADGLVVDVNDLATLEYVAIIDGQDAPVVFSSWPYPDVLAKAAGRWVKYEAVDPAGPEPVTFKHCGPPA